MSNPPIDEFGTTGGPQYAFGARPVLPQSQLEEMRRRILVRPVTVTTLLTLTAIHYEVRGDATSAPLTILLPLAEGNPGKVYIVKKVDSSANAVTLARTSPDTIDGAVSVILTAQYDSVQVMSNGANWDVVSRSDAPISADFLVHTANSTLTAERVVTDTADISWDWLTPGQAKANLINVGTAGTYTKVTTNANGQVTVGASLAAGDLPSHVLATNLALGAQHSVSGAASGQVLRASSATAANFQALASGDIPTLDHTTKLSNIGTNTHAQIDTHIAASNPHTGSAPLASPVFTGNPTGPTPAAGDNDTSLATTAYVQTELGSYAPKASPTFTGTITAAVANFSGLVTCSTGIVSGSAGASTKNSLGITINQGASDDEVLTCQSSDVAHGMTTRADTDTYGLIAKVNAAGGGMLLQGLSDTSSSTGVWIQSDGGVATNGRATVAVAGIVLNASKKLTTGVTTLGADQNIACFSDNGTTRFILDSDGDSHQDVGTAWTNFDTHDDLALLNSLSAHVTRLDDPLRTGFGNWLASNRVHLEKLKLVTFNEDNHHFVNMSRLTMLLTGAVRQLGERLETIEQAIGQLANPRIPELPSGNN